MFTIYEGRVLPKDAAPPVSAEVLKIVPGVYYCKEAPEGTRHIASVFKRTWGPRGCLEVAIWEVDLPNPLCKEGEAIRLPVGTGLSPEQLAALEAACRQGTQTQSERESLEAGVSNPVISD